MDSQPPQRFMTRENAMIEIYGRNGQVICSVRNLSATGACIEWNQEGSEMKIGDMIRMTVILKSVGKKHHVNAEVVWRDGNRSGVSFIPSNQVLDKLIERSS